MAGFLSVLFALVLSLPLPAHAAERDGVTLPDAMTLPGTLPGPVALGLNGIGVRQWSFLRIPIYVGGLYLPHPAHDTAIVMAMPGPKVVALRFLRDVSADQARGAWRAELRASAPAPLDPGTLARFLGAMRDIHAGDLLTMRFDRDGLVVGLNGRDRGGVADPDLARAVLLAFVGPTAASPPLRQALLGDRSPP